MNKIICLLACFLTAMGLSAQSLNMELADSAYSAGEYEKAIKLYTEISEREGTSAALLFNMGNAYCQMNEAGRAMLCYQRARKLDPSSSLINSNIRYLEEKIKDANRAELKDKKMRIEEDDPTFFQAIHASIAKNVSSNVWAIWGGISFVLFVGCVLFYIFTKEIWQRKTGFFGALITLGISIVCMICAFTAAYEFESEDEGILIAYKVDLLNAPGNKSAVTGILTRGTKVKIIAEEADAEGNVSWYKIRLNSDLIGWVEASDLEII